MKKKPGLLRDKHMSRTRLVTFLAASLLASPALAQSSGTWNDLPDRFQIDTGYFRMDANTVLRFSGPQGGGNEINFEDDLGIAREVDTFWVDATWRVGRRHQLKLGYTKLDREQPQHTIARDFEWGGETFNAGLSANTTTGSDILGGYYRFAAYRNERFEIGPTIGIGRLWMKAGIRATGSITNSEGEQVERTVERDASTASLTGAVGGYLNAWPARRLELKADFLYIKVKPENSEGAVTDWRLGADYYIFRNAGLGVQYKYNQYRYDRGIVASKLGGEFTYKGFQVFATFLF
jgi:hypothetical protein